MVQWRIVPGSVVLRGLQVKNGAWTGIIIDNKLYVDDKDHGFNPDGTRAGGARVLDFHPEDCERLEAWYRTNNHKNNYWSDLFLFAQFLYEADKARTPVESAEDGDSDDDIPF